MLLIPEIETVVILVPRCASTSIIKAITAEYPQTIRLYRHMEADGVPFGYDHWRRVGMVREPVARLWSVYKFMRDYPPGKHGDYVNIVRGAVQARTGFNDWLLHNQTPMTQPRGPDGYHPHHAVKHLLPENFKSQFAYLRPDLGVKVFHFDRQLAFLHEMGLRRRLTVSNSSADESVPELSREAQDHVEKHFAWDINVTRKG